MGNKACSHHAAAEPQSHKVKAQKQGCDVRGYGGDGGVGWQSQSKETKLESETTQMGYFKGHGTGVSVQGRFTVSGDIK
ncbi:uncharacterized protein G2W53_006209 [Senna tora]|uniref:Uncharacterized protein n=1 Tax=Senna tora TaxID=362788 RepID=A0A834X3L9_9FABA|nr:uncharacterized protein G2W53_006209 [Senna tora]